VFKCTSKPVIRSKVASFGGRDSKPHFQCSDVWQFSTEGASLKIADVSLKKIIVFTLKGKLA